MGIDLWTAALQSGNYNLYFPQWPQHSFPTAMQFILALLSVSRIFHLIFPLFLPAQIPKISQNFLHVEFRFSSLNSNWTASTGIICTGFFRKKIEKIWLRDSTFSCNNSIGIWISVLKSIKCWPDFFCCSLFIQLHLSVTDVFQNLPDFGVKPQIFSSFIPKPG